MYFGIITVLFSKWLKITTKQKLYDIFVNYLYALIESSEKAVFLGY